jgi:hypothetical protein
MRGGREAATHEMQEVARFDRLCKCSDVRTGSTRVEKSRYQVLVRYTIDPCLILRTNSASVIVSPNPVEPPAPIFDMVSRGVAA